MKKNYFLILVALLCLVSFLACNMVKGAGKDVEKAGKDLQKTADKNK